MDLLTEAKRLLVHEAEAAELLVAGRTDAAIAAWRLDEAMFWQRVRFRSRLLRAQHRGGIAAARRKGTAC